MKLNPKSPDFKHVYRYRSSYHLHPTPSLSKLWHVCNTASGVYNIPTVRHVQGGFEMFSAGYGLIKFVTVGGGGFYWSMDTTEDGVLLLVTF